MYISRRNFLNYGLFAIGAGLLVDGLWAEQYFIELKEIYFKKATFNKFNFKLLQLSDLHLKSVNAQLKKLSDKINTIKPDIILITGDAIDEANKLSILDEFLSLIDHQIKKIAILGNWEYWGKVNLNELKDIYIKHNCDLLINQNKVYKINGKIISVTGTDDFIGNKADFKKAVKNYNESDFHLVLNHCPAYNDEIIKIAYQLDMSIDLIMSGHTHGGQITYFGRVIHLPEGSGKYIKGMYNKRGISMYVSKGIGTSIYPIRFGARSEAVLFYV